MRIFKTLIVAVLMAFPWLADAQIPTPQINLSGNIGCQGFPCLNNGTLVMASDANRTMTALETSALYIKVTSSVSLTATRNLIAPAGRFPFTIENATTGGQSIQIIGVSGLGVTIANGTMVSVWNDGTDFLPSGPPPSAGTVSSVTGAAPIVVSPTTGATVVSLGGCIETVTFSSTPVFAMTGCIKSLTLTGNITSATMTGVVAGKVYGILFIQDSSGSHLNTFPTTIHTTSPINGAANGKTTCYFTAYADLNLYPNGACTWN